MGNEPGSSTDRHRNFPFLHSRPPEFGFAISLNDSRRLFPKQDAILIKAVTFPPGAELACCAPDPTPGARNEIAMLQSTTAQFQSDAASSTGPIAPSDRIA